MAENGLETDEKWHPEQAQHRSEREAKCGRIAPLEFMLQVMGDTQQDFAVRLEMAEATATMCWSRTAVRGMRR